MSKWTVVQLGEVAEIIPSNVDKIIHENEQSIKLCNYMDAYSNRYLNNKNQYKIGSATKAEILKFTLRIDDVIITKDSETPDDIAVPSVIIEKLSSVICGYHLAILRPKPEVLSGKFLMHLLQDSKVKKQFTNKANGSTRYGLTIDSIKGIKLELPDYSIQQKIAKILSTIDGQIEKTEAIIAKYQAVKQGMLQDLFTRGIDVTTGAIRPRYEDAPELYKDSQLGMIPREWEVDVLDSQIVAIDAQPDHRTPASVEAGIPYLGINDIDEFGNIDYRKCRKVSEQILKEQSNRYQLRHHDIIFGKIGTIGQPKRLKAWDKITISANVILIQPKENAAFIYWILVSDLINTQVNNTIHTTSQPAFGMEKIRSLKVVVPKNEERNKIAFMLDQQEKLISSEKTNLLKLNKLKQGLMSDLLSGKVEVTA